MDKFRIVSELGKGEFGSVHLAEDLVFGGQKALKLINRQKIAEGSEFFEEPRALEKLSCPYIVKVFDAGWFESGNPEVLFIAMEYLGQGSLHDLLEKNGPMSLRQAINAMCDVLKGLEYAHDDDFIHRDIKPGNILISEQGYKLSDFGLAIKVAEDGTAEGKGYTEYKAPETIRMNEMTKLSDIYAAGMTLYRLINGESFVKRQVRIGLPAHILQGKFPRRDKYLLHVPTELRKIINKAMNKNPSKRFQSAQEFRAKLEQFCGKIVCDWIPASANEEELRWKGEASEYSVKTEKLCPNKKGHFDFSIEKTFLSGHQEICRKHSISLDSPTGQAELIHKTLSHISVHGC
jgi:serine/threonine protein kinase